MECRPKPKWRTLLRRPSEVPSARRASASEHPLAKHTGLAPARASAHCAELNSGTRDRGRPRHGSLPLAAYDRCAVTGAALLRDMVATIPRNGSTFRALALGVAIEPGRAVSTPLPLVASLGHDQGDSTPSSPVSSTFLNTANN